MYGAAIFYLYILLVIYVVSHTIENGTNGKYNAPWNCDDDLRVTGKHKNVFAQNYLIQTEALQISLYDLLILFIYVSFYCAPQSSK